MGKRGEGWVALQFIAMALVGLAPLVEQAYLPSWLAWPGFALMVAGGALGIAGLLHLGESLTAFPRPLERGQLVTSGAYALVRHPIYAGLIIAAVGWALWNTGLLTLAAAVLLFVFFDMKSRLEERWLAEKYPDYPAYRQRVKKLIPWVY
ncbi:MAG: isoprenylcysteine carboxylmethyltransferase family protein [Chloroflexi bacterium]|nr:isoprenylcysteine carboxylmethyltransferase family protein [Chloroflexota bacterium]